jgi:type I restriction enzyme S subunit
MKEESENTHVPENWTWTKINQLGLLINGDRGKNYPSKKDYVGTGIPFINAGHLLNGRISVENMNFISEEKYKSLNNGKLVERDIIYCLRGTLGKCAIFSGMKAGAIASSLVILRLNKEINHLYIYYFLISPLGKNLIKFYDNGTAQPNLSAQSVSNYSLPFAPLPEQRAIVSKIEQLFSELDNGISNLKLAQEQLKVYRQAVLKKAFEGELTKKWREQQTDLPDAKDLLEQIRTEREKVVKASCGKVKDVDSLTDTELADLPQTPDKWKWVKLQELCNLIGGVTKGRKLEGKKTVSLPYLRVANVQDGYLDLSEIKYIDALEGDLEKYRLIEGDILYTEGGDKDKLGRGTIWKGQIENCIHQNHIFRARPYSSNLVSSYIGYFSQTQTAKNYFFKNAKQTVNLASINLTVLSNLPFPLCSLPEQQALVQEIETRLSVCDKIEQDIKETLEKAEALRQSILKKAFEGKLLNEKELAEVRGAEDWEPAEVLLERIKAERVENEKK